MFHSHISETFSFFTVTALETSNIKTQDLIPQQVS